MDSDGSESALVHSDCFISIFTPQDPPIFRMRLFLFVAILYSWRIRVILKECKMPQKKLLNFLHSAFNISNLIRILPGFLFSKLLDINFISLKSE